MSIKSALEWEKVELNHPNPKATALQAAPLPLRYILQGPGRTGLAIGFIVLCYSTIQFSLFAVNVLLATQTDFYSRSFLYADYYALL